MSCWKLLRNKFEVATSSFAECVTAVSRHFLYREENMFNFDGLMVFFVRLFEYFSVSIKDYWLICVDLTCR